MDQLVQLDQTTLQPRPHLTHQLRTAVPSSVITTRPPNGERPKIELILARGDGRIVAVEIKLTANVRDDDLRHIEWLRSSIGDDLLDAIVITTGTDAYRRADGIGIVPASLLTA